MSFFFCICHLLQHFQDVNTEKQHFDPRLRPKRGFCAQEMDQHYQKRAKYVLGGVKCPYEHFSFVCVTFYSITRTLIQKICLLTPVLGPKRGICAQEMGRCYEKRARYVLGGIKCPYEHFFFCICHLLQHFQDVNTENLSFDPRFRPKTGNLCPGNGQVL